MTSIHIRSGSEHAQDSAKHPTDLHAVPSIRVGRNIAAKGQQVGYSLVVSGSTRTWVFTALPCLGEGSGNFTDHFLTFMALFSVSLQKGHSHEHQHSIISGLSGH